MNFRVFDDVPALSAGLADEIVNRVENGARFIALSGGSTPRSLYLLLDSGEYRERLGSHDVVWITGDERCVPPDDDESNARMIRESLFREGIPDRHSFLRFRTESGDAEHVAADFEEQWRNLHVPHLDVAILGMGDDGHTASLFPGTPVLDVTDRIAAAVYVPKVSAWRVTLTFPVFADAGFRYVMAAGAKKREVIERIQKGEDLPVAQVMRGSHSWYFIDREAYPGVPGRSDA